MMILPLTTSIVAGFVPNSRSDVRSLFHFMPFNPERAVTAKIRVCAFAIGLSFAEGKG